MGCERRGVYRALIEGLDAGAHERLLKAMTEEEIREAEWDWASWAHPGQRPPEACADGAPWRTWVIKAGRGFGKTLAGAQWITAALATGEKLSIALVGATLDEARRVMVEGRSGLLEVADAWVSDWRPSLRRLSFRTGAEAVLFSGASPEQLRGPEHHLAWCDELAKWEKPQESWDMLQLGLRLGDPSTGSGPRALVTTTPRPGPVLRAIMAAPDTIVTGGPTSANPHLPETWKRAATALYAGTRLGRQELDGELLTDAPGALWTVELLERCRLASPLPGREGTGVGASQRRASGHDATPPASSGLHGDPPPTPPFQGGEFVRMLIAVDPPTGAGTCGIVACAKDREGRAHILADHSVTARTPEGWSRAVADAVAIWTLPFPGEGRGPELSPDWAPAFAGEQPVLIPLVVAEKNQGGAMVKSVLHTADPDLRVKLVTATVGKAERAAPVAMLFEAGRVVLHGRFAELEAEMLGMIAGGEYEGPGFSPDRADALVWALTELMLGPEQAQPRVRGF